MRSSRIANGRRLLPLVAVSRRIVGGFWGANQAHRHDFQLHHEFGVCPGVIRSSAPSTTLTGRGSRRTEWMPAVTRAPLAAATRMTTNTSRPRAAAAAAAARRMLESTPGRSPSKATTGGARCRPRTWTELRRGQLPAQLGHGQNRWPEPARRADYLNGGVNGSCSFEERRIRIEARNDERQQVKTLAHEIAHAMLHEHATDRPVAEPEAESVAYVVCHALGIDSGAYFFGYVTTWAGGRTEAVSAIKVAGSRIQRTANDILSRLDAREEVAGEAA